MNILQNDHSVAASIKNLTPSSGLESAMCRQGPGRLLASWRMGVRPGFSSVTQSSRPLTVSLASRNPFCGDDSAPQLW